MILTQEQKDERDRINEIASKKYMNLTQKEKDEYLKLAGDRFEDLKGSHHAKVQSNKYKEDRKEKNKLNKKIDDEFKNIFNF